MAAYIFFQRLSTTDAAEIKKYESNIGNVIGNHPIKILAFGTKFENLEGQHTENATLVEFPDMASAKAWYNSDAYTANRKHRTAGGEHMVVIFDGVPQQ